MCDKVDVIAMYLIAGQLPLSAEERRMSDARFNRYLETGGVPSCDPGDLIDMAKAPWPDEDIS